ncbi:MAG: hypothetical protein R2762_01440 [Bryobacteraceae bacterium]
MAQVPQRVLGALAAAAGLLAPMAEPALAGRFYPDDPIAVTVAPVPTGAVASKSIDEFRDFLTQSAKPERRPVVRSQGINTLGEVPDSAWYTNRHGMHRMSLDELRRGPGDARAPQPPYEVLALRRDGLTARLEVRDAAGRVYFLKTDAAKYPELATAADVIGSRFFYALGFHTPENYLITAFRAQFQPAPGAMVSGGGSRKRPMTSKDIDGAFDIVPRNHDASYRMMASLRLAGEPVGPFRFSGTRADDPNDFVPHEQRRDLRGLHVMAAWLNYTDASAPNTLDTVVEENGIRFLRHHLLDFDSTLGSDRDQPKDARFGNAFLVPPAHEMLIRMFTFGLYWEPWERADYPSDSTVGRFESSAFDPERWLTSYPNPAFLSRTLEDEYWAAKLVLAFTDDDIRAIVETGGHSDPKATEYIVQALCQRRIRIGQAYLTRVLALDRFRVEAGSIVFDDLREQYGFGTRRQFRYTWSEFDNDRETHSPIAGAVGPHLPRSNAPYLAVRIEDESDSSKSVTVFVRDGRAVVGLDRTW